MTTSSTPPHNHSSATRFMASVGPLALVFVASACVMVIEIVAGRLIARHVGSSLYTWTSIIAVVLAGVALGNYIGGWIGDRSNERVSRRALSVLFFISALLSLSVLWVHWIAFDLAATLALSWPVRILIGVAATFLLPSIALGAISPVVAAIALRRSTRIGGTIGGLYAWGSIGAIAGTLAAGFWLIPAFGTSLILFMVALCLGVIGLAVAPSLNSLVALGVLIGVALATSPVPIAGLAATPPRAITERSGQVYGDESPYQTIAVTRDGAGRLTMLQDDLIHGYYDPMQPDHLEYAYLQLFAAVLDVHPASGDTPAALLLGGGAYTFPRYIARRFAGSEVVVAEIDEAVTRASERAMHFDRSTSPIDVIHLDARVALRQLVADSRTFDFVFSDAFRDVAVPHHLTSVEFIELVDSVLKHDGVLVSNVIDVFAQGSFLDAYIRTVNQVFPYVQVLAPSAPDDSLQRDTFVVLGSHMPIDRAMLIERARERVRAAHMVSAVELGTLAQRGKTRVLTDDHAPVDSMISIIPHLQ